MVVTGCVKFESDTPKLLKTSLRTLRLGTGGLRTLRLGTGDTITVRRPANLGIVGVLVDAAPIDMELTLLQGEARQLAALLMAAVIEIEQEAEDQR